MCEVVSVLNRQIGIAWPSSLLQTPARRQRHGTNTHLNTEKHDIVMPKRARLRVDSKGYLLRYQTLNHVLAVKKTNNKHCKKKYKAF